MHALVRHPLFRILVLATWLYVVLLTQVGFVFWLANAIAFLILLTPSLRSIWIEVLLILLLPLLFYIAPAIGVTSLPTLLYFFLLSFILRSDRTKAAEQPSPTVNLPLQTTKRHLAAPSRRDAYAKMTYGNRAVMGTTRPEAIAAPVPTRLAPVLPQQSNRKHHTPVPAGERRVLRGAWAFVCVAIGMTLIIQRPLLSRIGLSYELPGYHSYLQAADLPDRELRASLTSKAGARTKHSLFVATYLDIFTFQLQAIQLNIPAAEDDPLGLRSTITMLDELLSTHYAKWREDHPRVFSEPSLEAVNPKPQISGLDSATAEGPEAAVYVHFFTFQFRELERAFWAATAANRDTPAEPPSEPAASVDLVY